MTGICPVSLGVGEPPREEGIGRRRNAGSAMRPGRVPPLPPGLERNTRYHNPNYETTHRYESRMTLKTAAPAIRAPVPGLPRVERRIL